MKSLATKKDASVPAKDDTIELLQKALTVVTGGVLLREADGTVLFNSLRFEARQLIDELGEDIDGLERELPGDQRIALRRRALADGSSVVWTESVTELRRAEEELFRLYHTDELTGLDNWRSIERTGENALRLFKRYGRPMSVLRIDIVGPTDFDERENREQIIKHVGQVVGHALRLVDHVARLRSGHFVAMMPETDPDGALNAAKRLFERVSRSSVQQLGVKTDVEIAIGISTPDADTESFARLVEAAARNMRSLSEEEAPKLALVNPPAL